jgi:DNA-binding NtrC family response regulator
MAKILIVDDEDTYRDCLRVALRREGYEIRTARNSHEAMVCSQSFSPDVLVVDWMLQEPNSGLELSKSLQRVNPGLVTVVISGYSRERVEAQWEEAKCSSIIEKPFDLDDIRDAVEKACAAKPGT